MWCLSAPAGSPGSQSLVDLRTLLRRETLLGTRVPPPRPDRPHVRGSYAPFAMGPWGTGRLTGIPLCPGIGV